MMGSTRVEILAQIQKSMDEKGWAPTVREIGTALGLSSTATVHHHLARLARDGFISKGTGNVQSNTRTLRITVKGKEFLEEALR